MASREELREHLVAVLDAAPELPKDAREHLADVFFRELDSQYQLVPRSEWRRRDEIQASLGRSLRAVFPLLPVVALITGLLFLLPLLFVPMFFLFHFPFLFLVFVFFFLVWGFGGPRGHRRRMRW